MLKSTIVLTNRLARQYPTSETSLEIVKSYLL